MPNNRKRLQGRVVSDKMQKTVVVEIERRRKHRIYEKVITTTKRVMAHDETDSIPVGAVVRIVESKPMSKRKRWAVEEVLVDPGNKVVESISDEEEIQAVEHIGLQAEDAAATDDTSTTNDASATDDASTTGDASATDDASTTGDTGEEEESA